MADRRIGLAADTALTTWFRATKAMRRMAMWSVVGAVLNVTVSAIAIMLVTLIVRAIGYARAAAAGTERLPNLDHSRCAWP